STTRPATVGTDDNDRFVAEQCLDIEFLCEPIVNRARHDTHQREIEATIAYLRQVESGSNDIRNMHCHARIALMKALNNRRKNRCDGFRASNSDLPNCWIGEEFDLLDGL